MKNVSPKLKQIQSKFENILKKQESFVLSLSSIHLMKGKNRVSISKTQQERLCEMTFVIMFTAWEQFLEDAFENYVLDARLSSFRSQHLVLVIDKNTAHDLICGDRKFVDWADPSAVRKRSKIFFKNGDPFETPISSVVDDLEKMKKNRNRCVHLSQHASSQYTKMIRNVFGSGKNISPGSLLMQSPPSGLSSTTGASNYSTVFQLYCDVLKTTSSQIVV